MERAVPSAVAALLLCVIAVTRVQGEDTGLIEACVDLDGATHKLSDSYIGPDGCNRCQCMEGGNACTKKLCPPKEDVSGKGARDDKLIAACVDVDGTIHQLNDSYIGPDACNQCQCMEGGSACTKKLCPKDVTSREAEAFKCVDNKGVLHLPGESYTHVDGCNTCVCNEHGGACTRMFCRQEAQCEGGRKEGESWLHRDGCNTCRCGIFGSVCTEEMCDIDLSPKQLKSHSDGPEIVLEPGDRPCTDSEGRSQWPGANWLTPDSCNICVCHGNGSEPVCTRMGCRVRLERLLTSDPSDSGVPSVHLSLPTTLLIFAFTLLTRTLTSRY